jgi:hypothetical protein
MVNPALDMCHCVLLRGYIFCFQVQKENCAKVPKEAYVQKERKECLPFELSEAEVEAMHQYDPCAQYKVLLLE